MPNNLAVTLDQSTTPWSVDVDQHGNANQVNRSANSQNITWQLQGNAATGSFVSFQWITNPPPPNTIFGSFTLSGTGKQATMSDLNNSDSTSGVWIYKLTINVDGTQYSTIAQLNPRATNTNPTIKNQ